MSSSRSVLSNESSHSNILTLSRDSSSSQIKSKSANMYYKKFISKLGFLFRIDTQDLDALYNKIVQCVHESDGFTQSDDADIAELIQLARKLQDNHNLLKNMVEVLDQRFLKKVSTPKKQIQASQKDTFSLSLTPQSKLDSNKRNHQGTSISNKYSNKFQSDQQQRLIANQTATQNDYSGYFADTLQKARQSVQRKKQIIRMEKQKEKQKQQTFSIENNFTSNFSNNSFQKKQVSANNETESSKILKKSMYEGRVNKIFQQMNKIKQQLHKIENSQNLNDNNDVLDPEVSLTFDTPFFQTHKTTQSQLMEKNKYEQDAGHQVFKQIQQDTYYLYDDRFSKSQQISSNMPKLSLKNLYSKMGINPNEDINTNNLNAMTMIKQSSRQSESLADTGTKQTYELQNSGYNFIQHPAHHQNYSTKSLDQYVNDRQTHKQIANEQLTKTKQANVSTQAGNLTLQFSGHPSQKQQQGLHRHYYEQEQDNDQNSPQSDKSHSVSNATIIDKLSTFSNIQNKNAAQKINDKQHTNTSIMDLGFHNNYQQQNNRKRQTLGSIDTTVNNSGKSGYFGSMVMQENKNKMDPVSPLQYQKSKFYMEIVQRNDKSREKINEYLSKLDERNRVLKNYVDDIEKSLSKEKRKKEQIGLGDTQLRKSNALDHSKPLTNAIYTDNEIIVPKYVPSNRFPPSNHAGNLTLTQPDWQIKKTGNETNFNFSQVNPIQKNNPQFSPKFNSYSEKQLISPRNEVIQSIEGKGMEPVVPMLLNLVENQEKIITNNIKQNRKQNSKQKVPEAQQKNLNKMFLQNNHYLTHECSVYAGEHHHQHESNKNNGLKITEIKIDKSVQVAKDKESHELQLISNQSLNSIQGRIQQHEKQKEDEHSFDGGSNPIVIPRVSANSLFEQTRNVQSKIQLSEDRGYRMVVPGEQIQRIKDRVNQMFKKMKPIRQEVGHLTKLDIPESKSIQHIQDKKPQSSKEFFNHKQIQRNQFFLANQNKIAENKQKFQFKISQKPATTNLASQFRSTGTFFNPSQQKKKIQGFSRNTAPVSYTFHTKDSLVVENNKGNSLTRLSFMYDSANRSSRESMQNRMPQLIPNYQFQNKVISPSNAMNYSRQSNFSFKPLGNTFGQDSIRSSITNFHTQHASRAESNSSSQQRRVMPMQILPRNSIVSKVVSPNRLPSINSVRSSSNQSKSSYVKHSSPHHFFPLKNGPPLPPKPQQLKQSLIKVNNPQMINHFSKFPIKNDTPIVYPTSPTKPNFQIKNIHPRQVKHNALKIPKGQNNINLLPLQSRGLSRNYSETVLAQSAVSSYVNLNSSQKQFIPPHIASVPIPVSSRQRRDLQNLSNTNFSTSIILADNSRGGERSTSRSNKSKNKKGIKVVSKHESQQ